MNLQNINEELKNTEKSNNNNNEEFILKSEYLKEKMQWELEKIKLSNELQIIKEQYIKIKNVLKNEVKKIHLHQMGKIQAKQERQLSLSKKKEFSQHKISNQKNQIIINQYPIIVKNQIFKFNDNNAKEFYIASLSVNKDQQCCERIQFRKFELTIKKKPNFFSPIYEETIISFRAINAKQYGIFLIGGWYTITSKEARNIYNLQKMKIIDSLNEEETSPSTQFFLVPVEKLHNKRYSQAICLDNQTNPTCIFVIGGYNEEQQQLKSCEKIYLKTMEVTIIADLNQPSVACSLEVDGNYLYKFGGITQFGQCFQNFFEEGIEKMSVNDTSKWHQIKVNLLLSISGIQKILQPNIASGSLVDPSDPKRIIIFGGTQKDSWFIINNKKFLQQSFYFNIENNAIDIFDEKALPSRGNEKGQIFDDQVFFNEATNEALCLPCQIQDMKETGIYIFDMNIKQWKIKECNFSFE